VLELFVFRGQVSPSSLNPQLTRHYQAVADLINQLLLGPLEKEPITISRNDTSWRDAKKVSQRFDLCKYFVQESQD
jgi:hypothetical protein